MLPSKTVLTFLCSAITELKVKAIAESAPPTISVNNVKAKQPPAKSEQKPTTQATATFEDAIELEYTTCDWKGNEREISDALYVSATGATTISTATSPTPSGWGCGWQESSPLPAKPTSWPGWKRGELPL
jgi:hypothetical protein